MFLKNNKSKILKYNVQSYLLNSYHWFIQYFLQILLLINFYYVSYAFTFFNPLEIYSKMSLYKSQFTIWRKIHILISGYSIFNILTNIEFEDVNESNKSIIQDKEKENIENNLSKLKTE
jgi:hypothetical protein